jgi:hypothetical protein
VTHSRLDPRSERLLRRAARGLAIVPALVVTCLTGTAFASPPETWQGDSGTSTLKALLLLVGVPLLLFVVITLLVYLPSMRQNQSYRPGQVWRGEPEWFGGPRGGLDALDREEPATVGAGRDGQSELGGSGGASGRW